MPPTPLVDPIDGAMTSSVVTRHALVAQKRWFMLATNDRDSSTRSSLARLEGYTGQK